jgi:transketolase
MKSVVDAFGQARACTDRPSIVIAHTVKGKGVSFMEDTHAWHGKAPNAEELARAVAELEAAAR